MTDELDPDRVTRDDDDRYAWPLAVAILMAIIALVYGVMRLAGVA